MGIVLSAVILYVCVYSFARSEAQVSRGKIFVMAFVAAIVNFALAKPGVPIAVALAISLIAIPTIMALLLIYWCEVERRAAIKSAATYMVAILVLAIIAQIIVGYAA